MRHFLLVILAILALTAGCRNPAATGVSVNPAFRSLIAPDTKALASVNLDKLKASLFYKRHQSELDFPFLDAMSERIGLDPRRDLSDILIAWNGKEPAVMARGSFDKDTLSPKLVSLGMRRTKYKSYTLFGDERGALAFAKHGVAVGGPAETVRTELDLASNGNGGVPGELQPRLASVPRGDQIWAVSRGGLAFAETPMRSDIESALSNIVGYINATSFGIGFDSGTHVAAEIICVSDQGAQRVRDALRGSIGLARLATGDNEWDMLKLYDSIQVSQDQQTVRIRADLSAELTDKVLTRLPQIRNRAGELLRER
jgi:hypothetical protein